MNLILLFFLSCAWSCNSPECPIPQNYLQPQVFLHAPAATEIVRSEDISDASNKYSDNLSDIIVTISGIKEASGIIRVSLYNDEAGFLYKSIEKKNETVTSRQVQVIFKNVSTGNYAISLY
ncbi:MAG: DUF2141 domain-containing protein, partial [Bacteroidota bacterium]